jgi:outer membrane protein assembly factor BamD
MRFIFVKFFLIFLFAVSLPGCETLKALGSSETEDTTNYSGWNAKKFYEKAHAEMKSGNYEHAIKLYEALETRYPFGKYAAQTQLDVAYAYFKNDNPEAALAAVDRFIKLHPRNPNVDYAYYLKGLVNYNRSIGFLDRFLPTDRSQRDLSDAMVAYENFAELIRRFPDSKYLPDAKQRMIALRNNIAQHEIHIARFYMRRRAYIAAVNRANNVVENYQRTPAVPYALLILQEAYDKLRLTDLAEDVKQVYAHNYPDGPPKIEQGHRTFLHTFWDWTGMDE